MSQILNVSKLPFKSHSQASKSSSEAGSQSDSQGGFQDSSQPSMVWKVVTPLNYKIIDSRLERGDKSTVIVFNLDNKFIYSSTGGRRTYVHLKCYEENCNAAGNITNRLFQPSPVNFEHNHETHEETLKTIEAFVDLKNRVLKSSDRLRHIF